MLISCGMYIISSGRNIRPEPIISEEYNEH